MEKIAEIKKYLKLFYLLRLLKQFNAMIEMIRHLRFFYF